MNFDDLDPTDQFIYETITHLGHARKKDIIKIIGLQNISTNTKFFDSHIKPMIKEHLVFKREVKGETIYYTKIPFFKPSIGILQDGYLLLDLKLPEIQRKITKKLNDDKAKSVTEILIHCDDTLRKLRVILKFKKSMNPWVYVFPRDKKESDVMMKHAKEMFPPTKESIQKLIEKLEKIEKKIIGGLEKSNPDLYIEMHNLLTK